VIIQTYLEQDSKDKQISRALAIDTFNIDTTLKNEYGNIDWAEQMDKTRTRCHNDTAGPRGKAVTYRHWILSPDPKDKATLEQVQLLARTWTNLWLGSDDLEKPGQLGTYEVAIVYHNDNEHNVIHAHVIANNTNLNSGLRFQANDKAFREMWSSVQEIAASFGLTYHIRFDEDDPKYSDRFETTPPSWARGSFLTKTERELKKRGRYVYKNDLRSRVQIAKSLTTNQNDFLELLDKLGVKATTHTRTLKDQKLEDFVYTMANNAHWTASGYRLGQAFTKERIAQDHKNRSLKGLAKEDLSIIRDNLGIWLNDVLAQSITSAQTLEIRPDISLKELADLLNFCDRYKIGGIKDFDRMIKARAQVLKNNFRLSDKRREVLKAEYNAITRAKQLAEKCELFRNVTYRPSSVLSATEKAAKPNTNNRRKTHQQINKPNKAQITKTPKSQQQQIGSFER
jgi:hypothetical protein